MRYLTLCSLVLLLILVYSCREGTWRGNLRLLSESELLDLARAGQLNYSYAVFLNEDGEPLDKDEKRLLNTGKLGMDYYMNKEGEIKEVLVRPITMEDKLLQIQLRELPSRLLKRYPFIEIDCDKQKELLRQVRELDQDVRTNEGEMAQIDSINQQIVVSLINKCGFPTIEEVEQGGISTIFLVFQHSNTEMMAYFYPMLLKAAERGDLTWGSIAMMQDRLLMNHGFPQIYGSQIQNGDLYMLEDPDNVNQRRKKMGLGPIEEYIARWDLDFENEKKRMELMVE